MEYPRDSILFGIKQHEQAEDHTQNKTFIAEVSPDNLTGGLSVILLQVTAMGKFSGLFGM